MARCLSWLTILSGLAVLATDTSRVPGYHARPLLTVGYIIAAVAGVVWIATRRYPALVVFGTALFVCSWSRALVFAIYEPEVRLAGIALNVILAVFTIEFVDGERRQEMRAGAECP